MKLLVFDIFADYGHFKKQYTTTSPLTYPLPTKPSIYGIISAIIGIDKNTYLNDFQNEQCKIGLKLNVSLKKTHIAENLIDTKTAVKMSKIKNRTQIKIEFIKDMSYRIFVNHSDTIIYNKLKEFLSNHQSFYTISFGLSENLANYNYIGEYEFVEKSGDDFIDVDTIIDLAAVKNNSIEFEQKKEYFNITIPCEMKPDREVIKFANILLERSGHSIRTKVDKYYYNSELKTNIILF